VICLTNQEGYESKELNESLHLQYYGFCDIDNLVPFRHVHTLFLNNNTIEVIQNLESLSELCTLNLSYNRIKAFRGLRHLNSLYSLDLSNNFIESIDQE
jgi:Leucine-rich repeat (LRR) protein